MACAFIKVGHSAHAIVDADDAVIVSSKKWSLYKSARTHYAVHAFTDENGARRSISMHRFLMGSPKGMEVDHIDRNGLNNRRSNLRLCTHLQNCANKYAPPSASGYRGVQKGDRSWRAEVYLHKKKIYAGSSIDPEVCARYYDAAVTMIYGEFATLNFPGDPLVALSEQVVSKITAWKESR